MASFSDSAFGKDTAFSSGAFDFGAGPAPTTVTGGHFLPRKKAKQRDFPEEREAKALLREQVRQAVEGPHAEAVQEAIQEYIHPQKSDSRYVPVQDRIDWVKIYRNMELVEAMVLMHIAQAEEDEDDEDFLLLNG